MDTVARDHGFNHSPRKGYDRNIERGKYEISTDISVMNIYWYIYNICYTSVNIVGNIPSSFMPDYMRTVVAQHTVRWLYQ